MLGPFFECTLHQLEQESSAPALAEVLQCELREATVGEPRRVLTQPASPYNTPLLHYNFTNIDCMPGPFFECTLHQLEQEDFVSSLAEVTNNADTVHLHMCGTCPGLHFARPDTSNSAHGFCQAPITHCIKPPGANSLPCSYPVSDVHAWPLSWAAGDSCHPSDSARPTSCEAGLLYFHYHKAGPSGPWLPQLWVAPFWCYLFTMHLLVAPQVSDHFANRAGNRAPCRLALYCTWLPLWSLLVCL